MVNVWVVRAGRHGEYEHEVLRDGIAAVGWHEVGDLTAVDSRKELDARFAAAYPNDSPKRRANQMAQLWALRSSITTADIIVLPMKSTSQLAVGRKNSGYRYRPDAAEGARHAIGVTWEHTDIPRTAVYQDLLYSLGAFLTVFRVSRNNAAERIETLLRTRRDPGIALSPELAVQPPSSDDSESEGAPPFDFARGSLDTMQRFISERMAGHELERLVAAVLEAEGFTTQVVNPGPDGGIDIFAGRGPLGLDSPKLIVQVKSSPQAVDAKTVRELHGVISTHNADQALLVAWGGVNRVAEQELRNQFFRVRVWDADALVAAITRNYDKLSAEIRSALPLRQIWALADDAI